MASLAEHLSGPPSSALSVAAKIEKTANPGPLGLFGLGLTIVVLSCINAGILPPEAVPAIVPLAFAYGGVAQLVAGFLEFRVGNTFGMVAFTSYGLFWWWYALMNWTVGAGWLKPPAAVGIACALLMWGVLTFLLWIVTFRSSRAVWSVFLLLWITFFLLAAGDAGFSTASVSFSTIGGYVGLMTGVAAIFVAFAELFNITSGRVVVSLGKPFVSN
jgi:succinate-acetate transporter protein